MALMGQVGKLQGVVETLQKQLALRELIIEELTGENANETVDQHSAMLHMPDSIEQMMDTLLSNP